MGMDKMKEFWKNVEEFLTHIPKIVLWIIAIIGLCSSSNIGSCLFLIAFILFLSRKD